MKQVEKDIKNSSQEGQSQITKRNRRRRRLGMRAVSVGLAPALGLLLLTGPPYSTKSSFSRSTSPAIALDSVIRASSSNSVLVSAKQSVLKYEQTPVKIPQTLPLKGRVQKGRIFVVFESEVEQNHSISAGEAAAAKAIGWTPKVMSYNDAVPSTLVAAMQQALQYKPVGVGIAGSPPTEWQTEIAQYKAAKVPIVAASVGPIKDTFPLLTVASAGSDQSQGKVIADWFIQASEGAGHVLLVNVPVFGTFDTRITTMKSEIASRCPGCEVSNLDATLTEVDNNTLVPSIVSDLAKNPSIKYVISVDGDFIAGLASALKAASITGIQIGSNSGGIVDEQDILAGTEAATTPWPGTIEGWVMIDAAARESEGMHVPDGDDNLPIQLLVKGNFTAPTENLDEPANYSSQYKALWEVNG